MNESWDEWCTSLWRKARGAWTRRTGQDQSYRAFVVLPEVRKAADRIEGRVRTLIDLGSGDGYATRLVVEEMRARGKGPETIVLVDRSRKLLDIAHKRSSLCGCETVVCDLMKKDWGVPAGRTPSPRLILSVFVLHELSWLEPFLATLADTMGLADLCSVTVVAPRYSAALLRRGAIRLMGRGTPLTDWKWAGEYPIDTGEGCIYLPHFHRTLEGYRRAFRTAALTITYFNHTGIPATPEARRVLGDSRHGRRIIGSRSAVVFGLRKKG